MFSQLGFFHTFRATERGLKVNGSGFGHYVHRNSDWGFSIWDSGFRIRVWRGWIVPVGSSTPDRRLFRRPFPNPRPTPHPASPFPHSESQMNSESQFSAGMGANIIRSKKIGANFVRRENSGMNRNPNSLKQPPLFPNPKSESPLLPPQKSAACFFHEFSPSFPQIGNNAKSSRILRQ